MNLSFERKTYKAMTIAGYSYIVLFVLFIISKVLIPEGVGGSSDPPIFDYLFLFCVGLVLCILGFGYAYFAWTRDASEFVDWYVNQVRFGRSWVEWWRKFYPSWLILWTNRIFGPFGALLGVCLMGFMAIAITRYLLN